MSGSDNDRKPGLESVKTGGVELRRGDRVRLHPRCKADIIDMTLEGQVATIDAIEQDYENRILVAVTVDADPGRHLGVLRQPGHRFFFSIEEVEPLGQAEERSWRV